MSRCKFLMGGAAALLIVGAGSALSARTPIQPDQVRVIPIRTATQTVGQSITVCMYRGARPSSYRVVTSSCRGGADYCTAWIELGEEEAEVVVATYDLGFGPVEATGPTCDQPGKPPSPESPLPAR